MVKQALVILAALCVWSGGGAWAAPDAYDPARLAGVWNGTRTTTSKASSCGMGKRGRVVPVRVTFEVSSDGTFIATLAVAPDYNPVSPPWRGQIVAHVVEAVIPSSAVCNGVPRQYEVRLSGELLVANGKQVLGLEGLNAPCPQQECLLQAKYELGRDE